jgi:class 3 adenylate cyclase
MSLLDDLTNETIKIFDFQNKWDVTSGRVVPEPPTVGFDNKATELENAVVLYADLSGSTQMVDKKNWWFSAEVYKSFLHCAAKIIKSENGSITAYDGDRVMAVFLGDNNCDRATRCGLKINYAVKMIITPTILALWPNEAQILHTVGIDKSTLRAARTGVRGDNDLVWIGRSANYAAKLTTLSKDYATRVTKAVYDSLCDSLKTNNGNAMWEERSWSDMNKMTIYRSSWTWKP